MRSNSPPARHYRKPFTTPAAIRRATLHMSALGIADIHLNGRRITDDLFQPGWADYHRRVHTRTHDVTRLMRKGDNCLGAVLADGWYAGYVGYGLAGWLRPQQVGPERSMARRRHFLAQLDLEFDRRHHARRMIDRSHVGGFRGWAPSARPT
jgi:alpha-L-rhamnosidase